MTHSFFCLCFIDYHQSPDAPAIGDQANRPSQKVSVAPKPPAAKRMTGEKREGIRPRYWI
jgi:hypothetical protein